MIYAGDQTPAELNQPMSGETGHGDGPAHSNSDAPPPPKSKKRPLICIQSGEEMEKDRMLRFVIGPENVLYADFAENLPGTAFWCNLYRPALQQALTENLFAKSSGVDVIIPADIMAQIDRGLRHQALAMISMARKAGMFVTGAEKTEQTLKSGKAAIYLTAAIKDADTRMKLTYHAQKCRIVDLFNSDELSQASGANKVFHAAMLRGGSANAFFAQVKRLNLFTHIPTDPQSDTQ